MKNFAELKRNAKNYTWEQYHNDWFGGPLPDGHKLKGLRRKIIKQQTNSIQFDGGSWLEWDKANCYKFDKAVIGGMESVAGRIIVTICMEGNGLFKNKLKYQLDPIGV